MTSIRTANARRLRALECALGLPQLPGQADDGLVGLELGERLLQQLARPRAPELVHEVDGHVVRRPERRAQRVRPIGGQTGDPLRINLRRPDDHPVSLDVDPAPPGPSRQLGVFAGCDVDVLLSVEKTPGRPAAPLLEVRELHVDDDREIEKVSGVTLTVHAGEIVALAGVDGNGQQELVDAITGMRAPQSGEVSIDGTAIAGRGVRAATDAGVAHIAEDRHLRGLVLPFTLAENLALREYRSPEISGGGWLRIGKMRSRALKLLRFVCTMRRLPLCSIALTAEPSFTTLPRRFASRWRAGR